MELFDNNYLFFGLIILSYLLGSIPTGKILGKFKGLDIQKEGSGNIGFANSVRVLGWQLGSLVLIIDVLKGYAPTLIASNYLDGYKLLVVGLIAVIGHIYPVWLGFRGGKGVATGLGVFLAISPKIAILGLGVYLLVFILVKKSAISSLIAAWSLVIFSSVFSQNLIIFALLLAVLGTYTHRTNLKDFMAQNAK